jgi:hypothetical protein
LTTKFVFGKRLKLFLHFFAGFVEEKINLQNAFELIASRAKHQQQEQSIRKAQIDGLNKSE